MAAHSLALVAPVVSVSHGQATTTSKAVADYFHKQHKHVLDKIESLKAELPADWYGPNFRLIQLDTDLGMGRKRADPAYEITRDGFTLLAMGFTGKQALQWKLRYIEAFNAMEARLRRRVAPAMSAPPEAVLRVLEEDMQALYTNAGTMRRRLNGLISQLQASLEEPAARAMGERQVALSRAEWMALQIEIDRMQLSMQSMSAQLQGDIAVVADRHLPLLRLGGVGVPK